MHARDRANPVGREELGLVQQVSQHPLEPLARGNREQPLYPRARPPRVHARDLPGEVWPVLQEPVHPLLEPLQLGELRLLQHLDRDERHDPDQRPDPERRVAAVHVELVVVEAVLVRPESRPAERVDRVRDRDEMLEELGRDVLVRRVLAGQLQRHGEHGVAVEGHPRGAVGLLEVPPGRQRLRAVEHADVVEPQKAAGEQVPPVRVLPVDPPGEVEQQLVERALEEEAIAVALGPRHLVHPPAGPGMHRRVHVAEGELVRRNLAIGMHVPLAEQQEQLLLGEVGIDAGEGDHVEGQVPGGEPGVLPLVRHRDDVPDEHVRPAGVAALGAAGRRHRVRRIPGRPLLDDVVVELLAPEQSGVPLPEHPPLVLRRRLGQSLAVELVGFPDALVHHLLELGAERLGGVRGPKPEAYDPLAAGGDVEHVVDGGLGADAGRVDRAGVALDHRAVHGILHERLRVGGVVESREVGLVLGEEQLGGSIRSRRLRLELVAAQRRMLGDDLARARAAELGSRRVAVPLAAPAPRVAEPERRQQVQGGVVGAPVGHGDPDDDVVGRGLGILRDDIEVPPLVEHAGVGQLELRVGLATLPVLPHQLLVRELGLGILVQRFEVGVGRGGVQVEVGLLDVFAVIAFRPRQAEQPLLEDGIPAVPERQREAEPGLAVADAEEAVLAPAIGPAPGVVVGEVFPDVAVPGVVLPNGSPLPLGEVRTPPLPVLGPPGILRESSRFRSRHAASSARIA